MSTFGSYLRALRKQQGISQRALAEQCEIDFSYISKIEHGHFDPPSAQTIVRMARVLSTDANMMLAEAGKVPKFLKSQLAVSPKLAELVSLLSEQPLPERVYEEMIAFIKHEREREKTC